VVVAPSLDAEDTVRKFKAKHKIEYPLLAGAESSATAYQVQSYPFMVLVGKDRKVLWRANFEDAQLEGLIREALKAKDPDADKAAAAPAALTVFVMKDGTKIKAQKVMDAGEEYSIKDENGKFLTVKKADITETIKP
jgi:hypothetical protein